METEGMMSRISESTTRQSIINIYFEKTKYSDTVRSTRSGKLYLRAQLEFMHICVLCTVALIGYNEASTEAYWNQVKNKG